MERGGKLTPGDGDTTGENTGDGDTVTPTDPKTGDATAGE